MFEHWGEFYLLVGSAAAVLIGLIFVVVTLMQDKPRSTMLYGSRLYMGPVVLQVSLVLVLSAAALSPGISSKQYAVVAGIAALWGFIRAAESFAGISMLRGEDEPHWTDRWFYGAAPMALFVLLAWVARGFWGEEGWAVPGVAIAINGILLIAIRNEWDLVTWLAPRDDASGEESGPA